ncbi:MAG: VWA domain-containing protein [Desulfovibrionaceae bacterium]|nr:VWA domain-containing protein [Desulfovibrionaceae bacterium]
MAQVSISMAKPLLQQGKTSVFQRLVTHPGAKLYNGPTADATIIRDVRTFTVMYIFARADTRLQVGVNLANPDGWIDKNLVTEWPQAITMVFTDRTGRDPVLFFKDHKSLLETCQAESVQKKVDSYLQIIRKNPGSIPDNLPIVATEPLDTQVAEKNFYLLPVLNFDNQYDELKLVEVASINPGNMNPNSPRANNPGSTPNDRHLRIGFAFVIDTSISMGPYIEQTIALIKHLYNVLEKSPYADKMAFAVVAFRSNLQRTPGLQYTSKVICDFTTVKERAKIEEALRNLKEATISSHDINEDSFAGIREAADKLSWENYGSRVMLLLSDAGPLAANDPTSLTGFSPEVLADYLREKRIYLTAVHVKGVDNTKNHAYAAKAYRTLTMQSDNQASYIPINATSRQQGAKAFHATANILANSYTKLLHATATGQFLPKPTVAIANQKLSPEDKARQIAASTGYAMQLQFLGNLRNSTMPTVVKAWIADADLTRMEQAAYSAPIIACEPCVLLTKSQLSNLYQQLKLLLQASEESFLNGDTDLFAQIRSAAAQMSLDPKQFELHPERNLVENNLIDEIITDLPYKSKVSGMTQADWESMTTGDRQEFILRLKTLIRRYEQYDQDSTHWESFGATNPNDWVYRVPLKMLP